MTTPGSTPTSRRTRYVSYLLMAFAGLVLAPLAHHYDLRAVWSLTGAWLAVGGILAAHGTRRRRWPGEYVGLPLVWSAFVTFAVLTAMQARGVEWPAWLWSVVNTTILLAIALSLFSRWREVAASHRASWEVATP